MLKKYILILFLYFNVVYCIKKYYGKYILNINTILYYIIKSNKYTIIINKIYYGQNDEIIWNMEFIFLFILYFQKF